MKFFRPTAPRPPSKTAAKPATFGAARAATMETRLQKAREERVKLTKAQYASPDPLNKMYEQKANVLDMRINQLKKETKE